MKKTHLLLAPVAALLISAPAFAADESMKSESSIEKDSNGNYSEKDKTVSKDASGKTTDEKTVDNDVDSSGNIDKTVKTKHVHSKGLFHTDRKVTTEDTEKSRNGKMTMTHEKDVNGETVEKSSNTTQHD